MRRKMTAMFLHVKGIGATTLTLVAAACITAAVWAMPPMVPTAGTHEALPQDTVGDGQWRQYLPNEIRDTAAADRELAAKYARKKNPKIQLLARSYGDSIVLRWSAPDYVGWQYLNKVGVNVIRTDRSTGRTDTLAAGLKPTPLEKFMTMYPETDSLAMMGMGSVYNKKMSNEGETQGETGSAGSLYQIYEDQQMMLGIALLVSEWRQDVANHMAMRWVDRNVKRNGSYDYTVEPSVADTTLHVLLIPGEVRYFENGGFVPAVFDAQIEDSVAAPNNVYLAWEDSPIYSSYEIERRDKGSQRWTRINKHPYISMVTAPGNIGCYYIDNVPKEGDYEYRILAHDAFGDLTANTKIHTVTMPDLMAPLAPQITWINIVRPNEKDLSAEIWAEIHFEKDTMEADYIGTQPMYFHEQDTEGKWIPLTDKMMGKRDTVCRVNVTGMRTGMVTMAAYDTAHNVSYSIPLPIRISDMKPPKAPTGLKAETNAKDGTIRLTWDKQEADDISHYDVIAANDSTHEFMAISHPTDTFYVDTVAMDVNQKYKYYKVRAVDYSTNMGPYSDMLQVIRPSNVPPTKPHIEWSNADDHGIHMRWITGTDAQMAYHHVLRRLESQKEWTLLRRCDADSVKAAGNVIRIDDVPPYSGTSRWVYAVESFNYSNVGSGLSLQYVVRFVGERVFTCPIKLLGDFNPKNNETRLAWELPDGNPPFEGDWYFCIWRQGPNDKRPKFLLSAEPGDRSFSDFLLRPGQQAHYYIMIQYADGRQSKPSNIITVKAQNP